VRAPVEVARFLKRVEKKRALMSLES